MLCCEQGLEEEAVGEEEAEEVSDKVSDSDEKAC